MMQWTTELPTLPGWYWVWNKEYGSWLVFLEIINGVLLWGVGGVLVHVDLVSIGTHWMGPLPEPEPPKVIA